MANKSTDLVHGNECKGSIGGTVMLLTDVGLKAEHTWKEPSEEGLIGTSKPANTGRILSKTDVKGGVTVRPSYANANTLLGIIFDETTGTFTPADDPNGKTTAIVVDRSVNIDTYADVWINTLTIKGNENEPLDWVLDCLGTTESDAGTVGALTIPDRMRFSDLTLSINANTYFPTGFEWAFTYDFDERFSTSVTRNSVTPRIPKATLKLDFDVNSDTWDDLFDLAGTDTALDDVNLVFTDGANTVTIAHPEMNVMNPSQYPDISGVDALKHTLEFRAFLGSGEGDIVTITYA